MSLHPTNRRFAYRPSATLGLSLIEVLVSLVVLSTGLLGLAALQAEGLKSAGSARLRFQATQLITDMIGRMQSNALGACGNHYNVTMGQKGDSSGKCVQTASAKAKVCTAETMAEYDVFEWKQALAANLPDGQGSITASDNETFTIIITWSERGTTKTISVDTKVNESYTAGNCP